jgi:TonB family protein
LCVISIPALLISAWPVEDAPLITPEPAAKDTIKVDSDIWKPVVITREPGGSGGTERPPNPNASGMVVGEIIFVADSIDLENETELGRGGDDEDSLYAGDDQLGLGDGGTVFILDTSAYQFNSANLDRPPFLITMDQPEYPALAKRIAAEGNVLLHILVDIAGDVADVRIVQDDNPGFGFGESAVRAAWSAVFRPALANHQPVRCWVAIPVEFEME